MLTASIRKMDQPIFRSARPARRPRGRLLHLVSRFAALAVALALAPACSYNKFTTQEEAIKGQWGQVENQLQRRNDLIPNLVESTKGFASALARLLVVVENYPQLKSNEQFARLQDELAGTENRLATERMRYNERIQEYNTQRRRFPSNMTAAIFGFKEYPYFDAPKSAETLPKVDFSK
jgi:LemA protein